MQTWHWGVVAGVAVCGVIVAWLTKPYWQPESDDMRRFSADWKTCIRSESADAQLRACTRLIDSGWVKDSSLPDVFNNRGVALWRLDRFKEAIKDYDVALKLNPSHENAYVNRGNSHAFLKKDDLAIADYTRALEVNPKEQLAYRNRGLTYFGLGKYQKAFEDYDHAVRLQPEDAIALNGRGMVWEKLGDQKKAEADYAAARAIKSPPLKF